MALGALAAVVVAAVLLRDGEAKAEYQTAAVDRGDVVDVVGATGTLRAVTTVQVGSQVSGTIERLHADFNSVVRRGEVVARLDPSLFEARLRQARANLDAARANVERSRASAEDARLKYARARELHAQRLLPEADLETARANAEGADAQLKATQAAVTQSEAAVHQAEVDLDHTVIAAPIDGVVVARNVDVGQTVAASLQAPTLFVIANDLRRMQVSASIDEADVGRVRAGQAVLFRVDAYPEEEFRGTVEQVRLQPVTTQNVVTYDTIIGVDNPEQKLLPGMTATVSVVVQERRGVLRVPALALRFRPPDAGEATRERRGGTDGRTGEGRQGSAAAAEGRTERPRPDSAGSPAGQAGHPPREVAAGADGAGERGPRSLYVLANGRPERRRVRLGLADGQRVEVREGLQEGEVVVVGLKGAGATPSRPTGTATSNPFQPNMQRRQR